MSEISPTTSENEPAYPSYIAKVIEKLNTKMCAIKDKIVANKREADELSNEFKQLEKSVEQVISKIVKKSQKPKKTRKPSGFALPVKVTPELCTFMGLAPDATVARTDVTKFLMKYINDKGLKNPEKKSIIVPDASLAALLGPEAQNVTITHFTIQKYINRHFLRA
jgi:upstream activation factor subunit UAF30